MKTERRVNKTILIALITIASVLALGLVSRLLAPVLISSAVVRESMENAVEAWLGHDVTMTGDPAVTFWPRPTITLNNITIRSEDRPGAEVLGHVASLSARFGLLQALLGKPVFKNFALISPEINIKINDSGEINWSSDGLLGMAVRRAAEDLAISAEAADTVIGEVTISGGTLHIEDEDGRKIDLAKIAGTLSWPSLGSTAEMNMHGEIMGQGMTLKMSSPQPLHLLAGRSTGLSASVSSSLFSGSFSGTADLATYAFFSGSLQAHIPKVQDLVQWADLPVHTADALADLTLSANLATMGNVLRFDSLQVTANGTKGSGVMDLMMASGDNPARVTGTLAFDKLDLWDLVKAVSNDRKTDGDKADSIPLFERLLGLDVRFSAAEASLGPIALSNVAVSVLSDARRAQLDILDSDLSTGSLTAQLKMQLLPKPANTVRLSVKNVDFASLAHQLGSTGPVIDGAVSMDVNLALREPLPDATVDDVTGTFSLQGQNGSIEGLALDEISKLAAGGSYFSLDQARNGETPFQTLDLEATLAGRSAEIQQGRLTTGSQTVTLAGVIPYLTQSLALSATIDNQNGQAAPLSLFIGGAWPNPVFWPATPMTNDR